ncbi:MAG: hypothetical protein K940chlam2_01597 [Chlamydiae bacterium]|nr:hypothetical protein [Chlamydiota bacterium]
MRTQRTRVSYDVDAMCITFTVVDASGGADEVLATRDYEFDMLPETGENRDKVALYGLNKLLTDRTSDEKDKVAKLDKMSEVFDLLCSGEWSKERVVGAPVVSVEVEALAQIKELSVPQAQAALAAYDKDVRAQILGSAQVQKVAQEIRELRAATKVVSLDDMVPVAAE